MSKPKSVSPRSHSSKQPARSAPPSSRRKRQGSASKRAVRASHSSAVSTPGLVGIGVMIGLTGHIVEQSRGDAWWSTQYAYAADAAAARQALLGVSPVAPQIHATPPPADPDVDPRPPVVAAVADVPEQPAVTFLDGLETPTGLVIPAEPAVERFIEHYGVSPKGKAMFQSWWRRSGEYDRIVEAALRKHRVPVALKALVFVESAFQPEAVSPAGASGLWQFMKATAEAYSLVVEPEYDQRFDPHAASNAAAKHLADLYAETDDWPLALAAYNYGLHNVRARLQEAGVRTFWELAARDDLLPLETRQYVPRVLAISVIISNQEHFGLSNLSRAASGPRSTRYEAPLGVPLSLLARAAGTSKNQLLKLNPQLRKRELPGALDRVTLNVRGTWYARIQSTLPLLMADGVRRRDLEVGPDFDWGKDDWVDELEARPNEAVATASPNNVELGATQPLTQGIALRDRVESGSVHPSGAGGVGSTEPVKVASASNTSLTPAPILGVGMRVVERAGGASSANSSTSAESSTKGASSDVPLDARPILAVATSAVDTRTAPQTAAEVTPIVAASANRGASAATTSASAAPASGDEAPAATTTAPIGIGRVDTAPVLAVTTTMAPKAIATPHQADAEPLYNQGAVRLGIPVRGVNGSAPKDGETSATQVHGGAQADANGRGLIPIRLTGQASQLNAGNHAGSFTPLGVTKSVVR